MSLVDMPKVSVEIEYKGVRLLVTGRGDHDLWNGGEFIDDYAIYAGDVDITDLIGDEDTVNVLTLAEVQYAKEKKE